MSDDAAKALLLHRLGALVQSINRSVANILERRFNVSLPEWRVIEAIGQRPDASSTDVAERSGLDKVAVSRAVARLLGKSLVSRSVLAADRRQSVLNLTDEGALLRSELTTLALELEAELLHDVPDRDRKTLSRLLELLDDAARGLDARA